MSIGKNSSAGRLFRGELLVKTLRPKACLRGKCASVIAIAWERRSVTVKTPRLPCFKLAAKFQRDDMIERFLHSGRSGYYFSVIEEGEVGAGDEFQFLETATPTLSIFDTFAAYTSLDLELLQRAAGHGFARELARAFPIAGRGDPKRTGD